MLPHASRLVRPARQLEASVETAAFPGGEDAVAGPRSQYHLRAAAIFRRQAWWCGQSASGRPVVFGLLDVLTVGGMRL
jgi:hypothetical protein